MILVLDLRHSSSNRRRLNPQYMSVSNEYHSSFYEFVVEPVI